MANKYTVYNTDTSTVEATGRPWPTADGVSDPVGMPANLVLLLEINGDDPAIDPATQRLGGYGERVYDTGAGTATRTREVVALTADEIAAALRESKREAMRQNWAGLNANVRGNYQWLFDSVQTFLDNNDDDLAVIAVQEVDPISAIAGNPTRLANFEATRTQFINAINNLTP